MGYVSENKCSGGDHDPWGAALLEWENDWGVIAARM